MEINIKWNICRICLTEEQKKTQVNGLIEPMRHIFDVDKLLVKQIYECSGITMTPNDNLPQKICKKCLIMIKYAVNFRKTCRASDTYLHSILQRTKSATSLFQQQQPPSADLLEEIITNDILSYDNIRSEIADADALSIDEQSKTFKRQGNHLDKTPKKICINPTSPDINSNADNIMKHRVEENMNEISLNNTVEEEEIVDHSKSTVSQMLSNTKHVICIEKEIDHQNEKEATHLDALHRKYFQKDEETDDDDNFVSNQAADLHNYKEDKLHYFKNIRKENISHAMANQQTNEQEEMYVQGDENIQFIPQEADSQQEMLQNFESSRDDNQAYVISTVLAKADDNEDDIIGLQEENSRLSTETNEMQAEYITDEYLIDDSNSDISTRNSNIVANSEKSIFVTNKQQTELDDTKSSQINYSFSKAGSQIQVWVCDLCGNHFTNRLLLNAHMKVHRQEKKHECELCFKGFITACNLQAHMRVHTGEKPFECQYCRRRFSDRTSNLRHERTHTNEKPFQCKECGKAFSLSTTLKKHLKVHTGERLYRCDICAKSFKLIHQLKAHKNTTLHKAIEQLVQQEQ